ncbi:MAG TPA: GAP family protein [Candidatus Saccharimonadales bacterium]|nr:GAP family protein [Candidatus Saccharimonadales bacterium]
MFGLYVALALLGLAAIDPVGIGIMPLLLVQQRPYGRSFLFLGGSFVSLMVMGLLFAKGLGKVVLHFERHNSWFVPTVEVIGGSILLIIAATLYIQLRRGSLGVEPGGKMRRALDFGSARLFVAGALLVAVQSVVDVVFVVAMVRIGQYSLSNVALILAVVTYAIAALILQAAVIAAFCLTPAKQKTQTLELVHRLLEKYAHQALIIISFGLGCLLLVLALYN